MGRGHQGCRHQHQLGTEERVDGTWRRAAGKIMVPIRLIDFYTHASSLKYVDFVELHERKPFFFRAQYERLKTLTKCKERLDLLDRNGVDVHVLVPMPFLESFPRIFNDVALAREGARLINDEVAEFV